jgi:CubicO group peptidase (beta-lactamase class C family)
VNRSRMALRAYRAASNLLVIFLLTLVASLSPLAAPGASSAGSGGPDACPDERRLEGAERALDINGLMRQQKLPGMSLAVIENFRIVCAKGYGVTANGGKTPVIPTTLFLAGSISKPVAAAGALYLVQQGKLTLDEDVNRRLTSWKVPDNTYTHRHNVTLRLLLSHTSGFTGGDFFPGYAVGEPLPTLAQILDGLPPATNPPMRVGFEPGTQWHYSGDGYVVVQQLMTDASGQSFPDFMRTVVFEKLGMHDSSYEEPLPPGRAASAASGTLMDGKVVQGGWHVNPEMAAGGLWSTPTDLAKLAIELALSIHGKANHLLTQDTTRNLLTPQWKEGVINILGTKQDPDQMGLGFFIGSQKGRFGHIGGNVGYQATLVMFADTGDGVVIMTNSDVGLATGNALLNRIAEVYGWNYVAPPAP